MAEFSDYAWLIGDDDAKDRLARLAADRRSALQQLGSLRKELPAERARLLVEQLDLRRRGAAKFGRLAERMFFTPVHLEQSTDLWVARYKAARLAPLASGGAISDYCCGIGGDLIALAELGAATGWDASPVACLLAEANVRAATADHGTDNCAVHCANVEPLQPPAEGAWHLDPDRRAGGSRSTTLERYSPGPELIERWRRQNAHGAVKLAPAAEPPVQWAEQAELEWITSNRECRQLVAWFGGLAAARGRRRATVVRTGEDARAGDAATFAGKPDLPCEAAAEPRQFLYDPDPSVLAAHLLGAQAARHGLQSLGAGAAYLTGERHVQDALLAAFAVHDCLPLRPAMIAQHLAARGVGRVEIKKRGVPTDPETLRKKLKLRGDRSATVVLTRIGERQVAIIAERIVDAAID